MKLWMIRHAQPEIGAGICYGSSDIGADEQHTRRVAAALAAQLPPDIPLFSSPLQRCHLLAQALSDARPDLQCTVDARLIEMDFGAWEGQPWNAIAPREMEAWTSRFADYACGGGETVRQLMARVAAARSAMQRMRVSEAAWITHAGVMRCMQLIDAGIDCPQQASQWPRDKLAFGEWIVVEV